MPESELAKRITTMVKALDKLIQDLVKDADRLREAARALRKDEEEKRE